MNAHPALLGRGASLSGLCQIVSDWNGMIPNGGCIAEPKIDGIRMLWIDGELVTRGGAPIHGAEHIAAALRHLEKKECVPQFFDGEWQVDGSFDATLDHFRRKGTAGDAGVFHVFDRTTMRTWRGDVGEALSVRKHHLDELVAPLGPEAAVRAVQWGWVGTPEEARRLAEEYIAAGGEGIVLKHANATYRAGRGRSWQRIKKAQTYDARIVDLVSRQDNGDVMATMVLDLDGQPLRVSAGFTDRQRFDFMISRERLVGGWAEIEAMERTETGKLREARFVRLREDK
jgi:DNA ligase-1